MANAMSVVETLKANRKIVIKKALSTIFVVLSFGYLAESFYVNFQGIETLAFRNSLLFVLAFSFFLFLLSHVLNVFSWWVLQPRSGKYLNLRDSCKVHFRSQIAKYIPGNVFHLVKLVEGATNKGLNLKVVLFVSFLQIVLTLVVGLGFGSIAFLIRYNELKSEFRAVSMPTIEVVLFIGILMIFALLFFWFKNHKIFREWSLVRWTRDKWNDFLLTIQEFSFLSVVLSVSILIIDFLLMGYIYYIILNNIEGVTAQIDYLYLTFSFAFAWTMGTIVPGAPGGMGVREAILLKLLIPFGVNASIIVVFLVLVRFVNILADAGVFFISYLPSIDRKGK